MHPETAPDMSPGVLTPQCPVLTWVIPHFQMQDEQAAVSHILEGLGKFTQCLHDLLRYWWKVHVHMALLSRRQH